LSGNLVEQGSLERLLKATQIFSADIYYSGLSIVVGLPAAKESIPLFATQALESPDIQTPECLNVLMSALDMSLAEGDFLEEEVDDPGDDNNEETDKKYLSNRSIESHPYSIHKLSEVYHPLLPVGFEQFL